jgi:hypothetical protein
MRPRVEERRNQTRVPEQEEFTVGVARQRKLRTGDDHARAVIPSHRIERNTDLVCHWMVVRSRLRRSRNSQAVVTLFMRIFDLK